MKTPLRILHLEDSQNDAELIWATLSCLDILCEPIRVETREDFVEALDRHTFDVILSDCAMPSFDGLSALSITRQRLPAVPFIFVSGTIGEEMAIETLKRGATDYVLKHRLTRLVPAIERALAEVEERSAREEAERSKFEAESLFGVLFDQVAVGVAIIGLDGHVVRMNPCLNVILGNTFDESGQDTGQSRRFLDEFAHLEDQGLDSYVRAKLIAGKRTSHQLEKRFIRLDGTVIWTHVVQSVIRGADGGPRFFLNLIEDISERKELERRFLQAQKMEVVGRLAAGIAHDFNNFLTVINAYSQMLTGRFAKNHPASHDIQEIQSAGEKAAKLTQRLLALGRPQAQQRTLLDPNSIVAGIEDMLRHLAGENIRLSTQLDPAVGPIEAGREQIEQVIMNLCINARDAMPQGGDLAIATQNVVLSDTLAHSLGVPPGDYFELEIVDTGKGMDAQTRSRMFEAFFTTKAHGKGTGLGLWMVQEIVKHNAGAIVVDSKPGKGTSFRIYLPKSLRPANAGSADASNTETPVNSETILVIEEQQSVRERIMEILQGAGYRVIATPAGENDGAIDLVITNSVALKNNRGARLLILCSSEHPPSQKDVAYLQQPFQRDDLLHRVREVFDAPVGYCILVADDDRSIRNVFRDVLRPAGFQVIEASGGRQAISLLRQTPVHLLIADLIMEDQEGLETIRCARSEFPGLKIIAMSGGFGEQFLGLAKKLGADEILTKPFRPETVREMIRRLAHGSIVVTASNY